jgi:hypothetical protein
VAPFFDRGPEALGAFVQTGDQYAEAGEIWRQTTLARQRSFERSHADWTEAFRGTRIIRDTHTGEQADVDFGYARDLARTLNEREPGRSREVPLRERIR